MKNVFKYLILLGVAALCAVSCKIAPMDNSHVDAAADVAGNPIPGLTIAVSVTADDAATVTVTADGAAAFISVLVDDSDEDQSALINPTKLYAGSYESVAQKLVKADGNPVVLEVTDLDPNTTYQVYAITANTNGVLGEIVNAHFLTTDTAIPEPEKASAKGNAVTVEFSEDITIDATKAPTAKYYAYNKIRTNTSGAITNPGLMGDAHVTVAYAKDKAGKDVKNEVVFTVTLDGEKPLPDGACYSVDYPAGIFADAVGNLCEALVTVPALGEKGAWDPEGIGGRIATKAFNLVDDDADGKATTPDAPSFTFSAPEGVIFGNVPKAAAASFTLAHKNGNAVSQTVFTLTYGTDWGLMDTASGILVNPSVGIAVPGDQLSYAVAAGSIEDIYGNPSAALGHSYVVSYGYTVDDVIGTYEVDGVSKWSPTYDEAAWSFTIEASDNAEKGNVMITNFYDFDLPEPAYCNFDVDLGVLTAPAYFYMGGFADVDSIDKGEDGQWYTADDTYVDVWLDFTAFSYNGFAYAMTAGTQGSLAPLELLMPVSGTFEAISDTWGYYYDEYLLPDSGNPDDIADDAQSINYDYNFFTVVPVSKAAAVAPAPIRQFSVKDWNHTKAPKNFVKRTNFKRIGK